MQALSVKEILKYTNGKLILGSPDKEISKISLDSRTISAGDLFIAIKGDNFNGHDFIEDVINKGASGIIVKDSFLAPQKLPSVVIGVPDTVKALGDIARILRDKFQGSVIAITGTVGKTTTKECIFAVMSEKFCTHKTEGTLNNHIGVPMTLWEMGSKYDIGIVELGMSNLGEIRNLAKITQPDVGVITNIGPGHLEGLGSIENVFEAKAELLEVMGESGLAVLNRDDAFFKGLEKRTRCRQVSIGRHHEADFQAVDIKVNEKGCACFKILAKPFNDILEIELPILGMHNVYSALFAAAIGYGLGIRPQKIIEGLGKIQLPNLRLELKEVAGMRIINDCYNANPISMESALETLCLLKADGKKIFACSDMKELGKYSENYHRELGRQVCKYKVNKLITVGELSKIVSDTAVESGMNSLDVRHCKNNIEVIEVIEKWLFPGDLLLIKGSRANKMEEIANGIEEYYNTLEKLIV
jgi:UDP-N-acetylmuramoyl-tripeptide--D-alanyl-D-alanine ligase